MRAKLFATLFLACALAPAQWSYFKSNAPNAPIPSSGTGGAAGACANAANVQTVVIDGAEKPVKATDLDVYVSLSHTYASDLRITLRHGGVSVVLFDRHPATVAKHFGGTYAFDDEAPATIAAAVNAGQTQLAPGTYQPHAPLSAFDGMSAAGPWIVEICDLGAGDGGTVSLCAISVVAASWISVPFQFAVPFGDGGPSGCVAPLTHVINVPDGAGPVSAIELGIGLTHGRASDLAITLTHGPVTVTIATPNTPSAAAFLGDFYYFADDAQTTWDSGVANAGFQVVPQGSYRPDSPFAAFEGLDASGPWFFTICDSVPNSVGSIFSLSMTYQTFGYDFELLQPQGASSITLANTGGVPGHLYLNAFTIFPGSFPYGWFHGLDISVVDLVNQIYWGSPFFGALDASGNAAVTIPGPIPTSLGVQFVSIELDQVGVPVAIVPARAYTTAP